MKCKLEVENCKQFNAPCCIGIQKSRRVGLNFIEPCRKENGKATNKGQGHKSRKSVQRKPVNRIKIRLADNPKDIVIKFPDRETLIKSLRELLDKQ